MTPQFITDFQERCLDVDQYMSMLSFFDNLVVHKNISLRGESYQGSTIDYNPNREIQKIMRANSYLVIYNLVESTANTIITAVIDAVNDSRVHLMNIAEHIRELYIDSLFADVSSAKRLRDLRKDLINRVDKKDIVQIQKLNFNLSGNVDYDSVMKIVSGLKCRGRISVDEDNLKDTMRRVKNHRNQLAHGNKSFSDVGACVTIAEIINDYGVIKIFLSETLSNLNNFLSNKKYLSSSVQ